jgi:hypothetical protein
VIVRRRYGRDQRHRRLDPVAVMELTEREDIRAVALEVRQRLERALAAIERDATA